MKRILLAAMAALGWTAGTLAAADAYTVYGYYPPALVAYDDAWAFRNEAHVTGFVGAFAAYNLQLARGPHVVLHNGTIIHPVGITLRPGMEVRVFGRWNADGSMSADFINVLPPRPPAPPQQ